ncbi:recombination mediator RecR [Arcobacter porcinus]|uniref:Recombination protein RecR n=1 Tax=Arcobacter porcinus TaxID=1935204 RepID=A0ABX2YE31_9BACT|nr:recombination mediator RecR [Arcobacter porcinus]OCL85041.1 Recombination protein RecR [Arcobacter porcinus]OCL86591.1 Recombination protein RecR [Arcobacter porcinus]OCL93073.1 Recombination protein RecR [Arcobacter porcinus]
MNRGLEKFYELVEAFEALPTIGKKSALRLAYHIVINDNYCGIKLSHSIENALRTIKKCKKCSSISENEICEYCLDDSRDSTKLCIVQSAKDIFVIEDSKEFDGKYFVIDELEQSAILKLHEFIKDNSVKNILFAITPSIANDAFILYIEDKLKGYDIRFTKIAQGVPTGVSLENVDLLSLSKAIQSKVEV